MRPANERIFPVVKMLLYLNTGGKSDSFTGKSIVKRYLKKSLGELIMRIYKERLRASEFENPAPPERALLRRYRYRITADT